ncbi:hypothetical protein BC835DRAFT_1269370 [Cytidiella melzeri]|nr:hypothetical protein BC835DRAFT_1269370 [Cytidiella melzeri]
MEFSQEVYHLIVKHVGTRSDLLSLCVVSKRFQKEAERALYNTLQLRGKTRTVSICDVLSYTPRLAFLVEALSIFVDSGNEHQDDEASGGSETCSESSYSDEFWSKVAAALRQTVKMRFFSVYLERVEDTSLSWILDGCTFQLHTFHSDFEWDSHLETFLDSQIVLRDLYVADYRNLGSSDTSHVAMDNTRPSLPALSVLECTFCEAAVALVPGRPVLRLKTCFSKTKAEEKRAELRELLANLRHSQKPLRALDLADESYRSNFTLELITSIDRTFSGRCELRYLGTLVFPVDAKERVDFYSRLMRLPRLRCVELEVTEWDPPPMTSAALRALTYELRIYCPRIDRVVYVHDFDRVVMKVVDSICTLDSEAVAENFWREI